MFYSISKAKLMSCESIIGLIFSITTAITAVVALFISIFQIKNSNKQSLFERRLKSFLIIKWMKTLCDEHSSIAKKYIKQAETELLLSIDLLFIWMTNCTYLEEAGPAIKDTVDNNETHRKYLLKMEELRNLCEEVRFIFPKSISFELADFIFYYQEMLVYIYKYKVCLDSLRQECRDLNVLLKNNDEFENKIRKQVAKSIAYAFELAEELTKKRTLDKAKKSIRLR